MAAKHEYYRQLFLTRPKLLPGIEPYKVKNPLPFPEGKLSLVFLPQISYLGRDADLDVSEGFPVLSIYAEIRIHNEQDLSAGLVGTRIGLISGWVVQSGRITNEGHDFWESCDCVSDELEAMASALFDEHGTFDNGRDEDFWMSSSDILLVERLWVDKRYRGYGLGLLALRSFIDNMPSFGSDMVILSPLPFNLGMGPKNLDGSVDPELTTDQHKAAQGRLERYYASMGFRRWDTPAKPSRLPFMGLQTEYVQVKAEQLVPHFFTLVSGLQAPDTEVDPLAKVQLAIAKKAMNEEQRAEISASMDLAMKDYNIREKTTSGLGDLLAAEVTSVKKNLGRKLDRYIPYNPKTYPPGFFDIHIEQREFSLGGTRTVFGPISSFNCSIGYCRSVDDENARKVIGGIRGWMIGKERLMDEHTDLHEAAKSISDGVCEMVKTLYQFDGELRSFGPVREMWEDEASRGDTLFIEHCDLQEAYRGWGISLVAISQLIDMLPSFSGDAIIIRIEAGAGKLQKHFGLMGFTKWGPETQSTPAGIEYWGISTAFQQRDIREIVPRPFQQRTTLEWQMCDYEEDGDDMDVDEEDEGSNEESDEDDELDEAGSDEETDEQTGEDSDKDSDEGCDEEGDDKGGVRSDDKNGEVA